MDTILTLSQLPDDILVKIFELLSFAKKESNPIPFSSLPASHKGYDLEVMLMVCKRFREVITGKKKIGLNLMCLTDSLYFIFQIPKN